MLKRSGEFTKIPRYWFSKMYHNYSISQRFPKLILQDVPYLFKISKISKNDLPRCTKIPRCNKMNQDFKIPKIHLYDFPRSTRIYLDSKIIQNYARSQKNIENPRCRLPIFPNDRWNSLFLTPPKFNFSFFDPQHFQDFQHWPWGFPDTCPFQKFHKMISTRLEYIGTIFVWILLYCLNYPYII